MKKFYNKLVRDNIPSIIEANGEEPIYRVLDDEQYWEYLLLKDTEELEEVRAASNIEDRKKELADKLELLIAMAKYNGFTLQDILEEADKKRENNGGFDKKLLLESVISESEDLKEIHYINFDTVWDKNWRNKIGNRKESNKFDWRLHMHYEYVQFVLRALELANKYNWSFWGGGNNNFAITLSQSKRNPLHISICLLGSDKYCYYSSFCKEWNPKNINKNEYQEKIGNMNDAINYLEEFLKKNIYDPEYERTIIEGNAFSSFPCALKWAQEDLK